VSQIHSSASTSINVSKLPAVYNKIPWHHYTNSADVYHILDIGCGRIETQGKINSFLFDRGLYSFFPYDPYHECIKSKKLTKVIMNNKDFNKVVICSNVLNVIDNDESLDELIALLCDLIVYTTVDPPGIYVMNPCYITVYEGDRTGVGRESKKDCWQRNERLCSYLDKFNNYIKNKYGHNSNFFKIKYGMIVGINQSCK
jgi:hypothetical protein